MEQQMIAGPPGLFEQLHDLLLPYREGSCDVAVQYVGQSASGRLELGFEPAQRRVAVDCVLECRAVERRRFLRDVSEAPARGIIDLPLVRVQLAAQEREEARLAGAVGADEADLLAGIQREIGGFEQNLGPAYERELGEANHRSGVRKGRIVDAACDRRTLPPCRRGRRQIVPGNSRAARDARARLR